MRWIALWAMLAAGCAGRSEAVYCPYRQQVVVAAPRDDSREQLREDLRVIIPAVLAGVALMKD